MFTHHIIPFEKFYDLLHSGSKNSLKYLHITDNRDEFDSSLLENGITKILIHFYSNGTHYYLIKIDNEDSQNLFQYITDLLADSDLSCVLEDLSIDNCKILSTMADHAEYIYASFSGIDICIDHTDPLLR